MNMRKFLLGLVLMAVAISAFANGKVCVSVSKVGERVIVNYCRPAKQDAQGNCISTDQKKGGMDDSVTIDLSDGEDYIYVTSMGIGGAAGNIKSDEVKDIVLNAGDNAVWEGSGSAITSHLVRIEHGSCVK
jgi:uncharacterized Zn ribbon protein